MDYLTAWREGHEAGMQLSLKIINELTGHDFNKSAEVVLYIKHLEGNSDFEFVKQESTPKPEVVDDDQITKKENKLINTLANRIVMRTALWS